MLWTVCRHLERRSPPRGWQSPTCLASCILRRRLGLRVWSSPRPGLGSWGTELGQAQAQHPSRACRPPATTARKPSLAKLYLTRHRRPGAQARSCSRARSPRQLLHLGICTQQGTQLHRLQRHPTAWQWRPWWQVSFPTSNATHLSCTLYVPAQQRRRDKENPGTMLRATTHSGGVTAPATCLPHRPLSHQNPQTCHTCAYAGHLSLLLNNMDFTTRLPRPNWQPP